MPTQSRTNAIATTTTAPAATERRTLHRLRELCDEVIASYRAAKGSQLFSDRDRAEGRALLEQLTPVPMPVPVPVRARRR